MDPAKHTLHCTVDRFDEAQVIGWARYVDSESPVDIEIVVNGCPAGSFRADLYRKDLSSIRPDGAFAFHLKLGLEAGELREALPAEADVLLRDAKTGEVLPGSRRVFGGLAPKGQEGLRNSLGQRLSLAKGKFVVPLSERSPEWRARLLRAAKQLASDAARGGFALAAAYGTLLGAVREGALIPHDDDVDLMFLARGGSLFAAVQELHALAEYLRGSGYRVTDVSNGQLHARGDFETIDIFLAWFERDRLNLTFTIKDGPERHDILPFSSVCAEGIELPSPHNPASVLEATYGPGWATPDPAFRWKRPAEIEEFFAPIHNYNRAANADYWRGYYTIRGPVAPPEYPSQFAIFALGLQRDPGLIVDLGCGSGRDSLYFASIGTSVVGVDFAETAISENTARARSLGLSDRASFLRCDVSNLLDVERVIEYVGERRAGRPLCIYSRFFFHAIDENTEGAALLLTRELMTTPSDFATFEFRTDKDQDRQKVTPTHYRRYVNPERFLATAASIYGLECVYRAEGLGFAVFGADDAHVVRLVLQRRT